MDKEIKALTNNSTWDLVPFLLARKPLKINRFIKLNSMQMEALNNAKQGK